MNKALDRQRYSRSAAIPPWWRTWLAGLAILLCLSFTLAGSAIRLSDKLLASVEQRFGGDARKRLLTWQKLMASNDNRHKSELEKLELVNNFQNQMRFVDDIILWKVEDYWATPVEFLSQGAGDCEDFSIAKYFTLLELGVPVEKLRITYVKALRLNQAHMVLTYYETPGAMPLVLDNLIPEIKRASERPDLLPIYSFNGQGLFLFKGGGSQKVGGSERVSLWGDLVARMAREMEQ